MGAHRHVWVTSTVGWGRPTLGSWRRRRSGVEGLGGAGWGRLLGTTYFKSRAVPYRPLLLPRHPHPLPLAPPRSVVAFVIVIWPCLLNASTVYFAL